MVKCIFIFPQNEFQELSLQFDTSPEYKISDEIKSEICKAIGIAGYDIKGELFLQSLGLKTFFTLMLSC